MFKKIIFRPKTIAILNNEKGSVIIAALMVLVLLTIIGISSTNVSNTEIKISTHELIYQQHFYRAEGATLEAFLDMEGIEDPETNPPSYLWSHLAPNTFVEETTPYDKTFWDGSMTDAEADPQKSTILSDDLLTTQFAVISKGPDPTYNDLNAAGDGGVYRYTIYGRCETNGRKRGATTVEIGYIKAF